MSLISLEKNFVFIILRGNDDNKQIKNYLIQEHDCLFYGKEYDTTIPKFALNYPVYAIIRNPLEREIDIYEKIKQEEDNFLSKWMINWTFEEYIEWLTNPRLQPRKTKEQDTQFDQLKMHQSNLIPIKFNSINEILKKQPFNNNENLNIKNINIESKYNNKTLSSLYDYYASDFSLYGF